MKPFHNQLETYRNLLAITDRYCREVGLDRFVSLVGQFVPKSGCFLELGCGTGEPTQRLAAKGSDIIGVDVSLLFLKAKDASPEERKSHFTVADITALPFQAHSVSCV
jgi:ubiquinone/menaquinone biosynthesis C-methylase UbiE